MKPFCETIVAQVLPVVRALLAKKLSDKGLKNKDIAEAMELTPSAVTQYLNKARGKKTRILMKNKPVNKMISELAGELAEGKLSPAEKMNGFCRVCKEVRKERILCRIHNGPESCNVCIPR
jgi:predicted transcriptional regulator